MKNKFLLVACLICSFCAGAQTKIGTNPVTLNTDALLELESSTKGLLLPRVALNGTGTPSPLTAHVQGMTVYNTATTGDVAPGFYYNNGIRWVRIANTVSSYTSATAATAANPSAAVDGNLIYDQSCNCAKLYTGGMFVELNDNAHAKTYSDTSAANAVGPSQRLMGNIIFDQSINGIRLFNGNKWITPAASPLNYVFADTNAANTFSPSLKVQGQQIFDNSCSCLKAYVNNAWRLADGSTSSDATGFSAGISASGSLIAVAVSLGLTGSSQEVNYNIEDYDAGNNFSSSSADAKFTAPNTGIYHFDVGILTGITANVLGNYNAYLVVNSSIKYTQPLSTVSVGSLFSVSTQGHAVISKDLKLNAGDEVRVVIGNTGIASLGLTLVQGSTYFDGHLVK